MDTSFILTLKEMSVIDHRKIREPNQINVHSLYAKTNSIVNSNMRPTGRRGMMKIGKSVVIIIDETR